MLLALTETFDPAEKPCERKTFLLFCPGVYHEKSSDKKLQVLVGAPLIEISGNPRKLV